MPHPRSLLSGRIDRKLASVLLYSMQVASQNLNSHHPSDVDQTIESMTVSPQGDELAAEEIVEEDNDAAEDGDDELDDDSEEVDEGSEEDGSDEGNDGKATDNDAAPNPEPEKAEHPDAIFFRGLIL